MVSKYTEIYPPNGKVLLDGGLDTKFDKALLPDNESPDCLNVRLNNGAVETRGGTAKLNTATVGTFACNGLYTRHNNNGTESMVAFFGQHMYVLVGTSFITVPSAQSMYTADVRIASTEYENYLFADNGDQISYKYNGTYTRHGVYPPTQTAVAFSGATGPLTGAYQYKYTYVNSGLVESDVGPISASFTAASATIGISNIAVAPTSFGVVARRIYRTTAGGTSFKRVVELSDNTTTTYSDAILDVNLGVDAPTDQGVPPKYTAAISFQDRIFMNDVASPNLVKYTELANPYVVKATNFFRIGDNAADTVKGFAVYNNALVVFGNMGTYLIYMESTDPSSWRQVKTKSPYGSDSPFAAAVYNNKVMHPAKQNRKFVGFSAISGETTANNVEFLTVAAVGSDQKSLVIEPDMFNVVEALTPNMSAIVYKNKLFIAMTYGSGNTRNNRYYVFDFSIGDALKKQEGSWIPNDGNSPAQFTIYNGNLYYGTAATTGYVYQMETSNYNDDGAAINSYIWTKEFGGLKGEENLFKDYRFADILHEKPANYFMNFTYRVDSDKGSGTTVTINLNPGGSLWGTMIWGVDDWGGGQAVQEIHQFLGASLRGKRIQFKFDNQNTVNQKFKILGLSFGYNRKGRR